MPHVPVLKPASDEHAPYFARYIDLVPEGDISGTLTSQIATTRDALNQISEEASLKRYAEGKWSIREVVGHLIDTERVFAYRLLRIARNDKTPLAGFDQDDYIPAARFDQRPWADLVRELEVVRLSTILLLQGLPAEAWERVGVSNNHPMSTRAAAYIIAGHERHHMNLLHEKYGV